MKVVDRKTFDSLKSEQIRLVSKKHVEGLSRKEHQQLDDVNNQLSGLKVEEELVEFDYFY